MQNYINYIIGFLIIGAVGFLVYTMSQPTVKPAEEVQNTQQEQVMNSGLEEATTTGSTATTTTATKTETNKKMKATYMVKMETTKGNITLELNTNIAPKTVANFTKLAGEGFYNGVRFHRVIKDFMIQSGDPLSKDVKMIDAWGTGGPGYKFEDEITDAATYKTGYKRGVLAMANSGPNTNGSQFFIMHKDVPLPPNYTIFGKVISGLEIVDAIASVKTVDPARNNDRPVDEIVITKVTVE